MKDSNKMLESSKWQLKFEKSVEKIAEQQEQLQELRLQLSETELALKAAYIRQSELVGKQVRKIRRPVVVTTDVEKAMLLSQNKAFKFLLLVQRNLSNLFRV